MAGKIALHIFCIQIANKVNNVPLTDFEQASSVYESANAPCGRIIRTCLK
jgi:hypothetical protein